MHRIRTPWWPVSLAAAITLVAAIAGPAVAQTEAPDVTAQTCHSQWYFSNGGTASWQLLRTDPKGLPLSSLAFSRSYSDPTDLSHGYLDFNRDGKSDVFAAVRMASGKYQWMYSPGGTGAWVKLATGKKLAKLRFGDFNGDGYTDVFFTTKRPDGSLQWHYAPGGNAPFVNLAYAGDPLASLRFGDFNGDGRTDVFALHDIGAGFYGWDISYSGVSSYVQINSATTALGDLQFGDINGDGHTDVFTATPSSPGNYDWKYSSAGSAAYTTFVTTDKSVDQAKIVGDFDGDHRSDWFYTTLQNDGTYQWWWFFYRTSPFSLGSAKLAFDGTKPAKLRFADFSGDLKTDVFHLTRIGC
jgi:hypothetical protein